MLKRLLISTTLLAFAGTGLANAEMTAVGDGEGQLNIVAWPGYIERGETDKAYDWVTDFEKETGHFEGHLNVAIMGCEVNGPGEAKEADIGIAFGANKAVLFSKGVIIKNNIPKEIAKDLLKEEIYNMTVT